MMNKETIERALKGFNTDNSYEFYECQRFTFTQHLSYIYPFNFAEKCGVDIEAAKLIDILKAMDTFTKRECQVVLLLFEYRFTLNMIGDYFEITAGRVGQIRDRAMRKFKAGYFRLTHPKTLSDTTEVEHEKPTIDQLELSVRSYNCLHRKGIKYIDELITVSLLDLMKIRNLGNKSLNEILDHLEKYAGNCESYNPELSRSIFDTLDTWRREIMSKEDE